MATEWAGDVNRRESPRSQFARELAIENVRQRGEERKNLQSKYAAAMAEKDKRDYEMALETWKNFGSATVKQQKEFKQKIEAYTAAKKLFKRQGLQVFDDNGEIIFPPSRADAGREVREAIANAGEAIRAKRKPNQQELGTIIGALNNAREVAQNDDEIKKLDKLIGFFENNLGTQAGVQTEDENDPAGIGQYLNQK